MPLDQRLAPPTYMVLASRAFGLGFVRWVVGCSVARFVPLTLAQDQNRAFLCVPARVHMRVQGGEGLAKDGVGLYHILSAKPGWYRPSLDGWRHAAPVRMHVLRACNMLLPWRTFLSKTAFFWSDIRC